MYIVRVTFRHRNDFHFVAHCRHCGRESEHGDGYADAYYQTEVFPNRACCHCGRTESGETTTERDARWAAEATVRAAEVPAPSAAGA